MRGPQDEKLTAFDEETPTCRTQRSTPRARASPPRATPELARGSNGVREIGKLRRVTLISRSQYPGLGLRRLLLQRLFPGLRRRAGLWNQPSYSRNQGFLSPRERVPEKSVPEKHASEAAAVESKTESQHKTGRSRKKRDRGD